MDTDTILDPLDTIVRADAIHSLAILSRDLGEALGPVEVAYLAQLDQASYSAVESMLTSVSAWP